MGHSFLPSNTKIFRAAKNVHRFFYFLNNRVYTFVTFEKGFSTQVAALFGALNALTAGMFLLSGSAQALDSNALPTGYQSVSGNVTFNQTQPNVLNVSTQANKSIASYDTFNIGSNATVNFNLPSSSSRILNRVNAGGGLSEIYGHMNSNGQVMLINTAGVFFGGGSVVNVGGLVASTLNITDNDFLGGNLHFYHEAGSPLGAIDVANGAKINASDSASFIASSFSNAGEVTSGGAIQVAVGDKVTLADDLVGFTIDEGLKDAIDHAAIANSGNMTAEAVKLASKTIHDATKASIVNTGTIKATNAVTGAGGVIELIADGGVARQAGTLDATGSTGGQINVLGDYVSISNGSLTDASGTNGGGNINIGGGFQGSDPSLKNAEQAAVGETAQIKADAIESGNGGNVVVWSDKYTRYYGDISAKGGATSGDGGHVEVSGKEVLDFYGTVNATAAHGKTGTLLLDPRDLTIVDAGGTLPTLNDFDEFSDTFNANGSADAGVVNLAMADVTLRANRDIFFNNTTTGISLTNLSFTAEAGRNIVVNNTGAGTVNISADNGITLTAGRNIDVNGATLTTSNASILLQADQIVPSTPSFTGAGHVFLNAGSSLLSNGGNVILSALDNVKANGTITTSNGTLQIVSVAGKFLNDTGVLNAGTGDAIITVANQFDQTGSLAANNINITSDQFILRPGGTLNAFTFVTLKPNSAKSIIVGAGNNGGAADTPGALGIYHVSAEELSRISATSVIIGDSALAGGASLQGNVDMSTFGGGGYNLVLNNDGLIDNVGTLVTNNHALVETSTSNQVTFAATADIDTGTYDSQFFASTGISAAAGSVLNTNDLDMTTSTGGISLLGDVIATATVDLAATNSGDITQGTGKLSGTDLTTSVGNGNTTIDNADFTNADLDAGTPGNNIFYKDSDGVSASANTAGLSAGTVTIETSAAGLTANNTIVETDLNLASGTTQAGTVNLTANLGNITQSAGALVTGKNLVVTTDGNVTLGANNNLDFAQYTLNSAGAGNTFDVTDTDNFEVLGVTANNTNVLLTASGSGVATDFNGNPLAPGVAEIDMQVSGVITANNLTLTGKTGSILLNNDITTGQALVVDTKEAGGDITQAALKTITAGTTSDLKTEGATGADITINGDVNATDANTVETLGAGAVAGGNTITVATGAGVKSTNGTATLSTAGQESVITVNGNVTSTNADVVITSTGVDGDIEQGSTSLVSAGTDVDISTHNNGSALNIDGDVTATAGKVSLTTDGLEADIHLNPNSTVSAGTTATIETTGSDSSIYQRDGSTVTAAGAVTVDTTSANSEIEIAGDLTSNTANVDITTAGNNATITLDSTATVLASTDVNVETTGDSASISEGGSLTATLGNVLVSTADATSNIDLTANSVINAGDTATIETTWLDSDITQLDGSTVTAANAVKVSTAEADSTIEIGGDLTSTNTTVDVTTTGVNATIILDSTATVLAKTNATVSTTGQDAAIDISGDVTATTGNALVSTTGRTSDITLQGTADLEGATDASITTTGLGSDITLQTDGLGGGAIVNSSGNTVTLSTTNRYADILTQEDTTVSGKNAVVISTADRRSDIELNGSVSSATSTVNVTTTGDIGTITVGSTGSILADTDATVSTTGQDSTIDISGDVTATNGNALVSTTGRTSDITLHGTADLEGKTDASITTTGLGSDITLELDGMGGGAIVNSGGTATLSTTNRYADITTAVGTTVTGVGAVTVSTAERRSDISIAGSVTSTADKVDVKTTGDIATITAGSISAQTDATISTIGVDSTIDLHNTVSATTGNALVSTTGNTSDIVLHYDSELLGATDASITTTGLGSDITLQSDGMGSGALVNSGSTVTLSTTNRYADIYTGANSSITGVGAVAISTADRRSDIEIAGAVISNMSTVDVTTTGDIGTITIDPTGSILANTDATVSTAGVDATIDIDGTVTATNGAVLVSTTGDTSDITLNGADLEGKTDVSITTIGLGSDITLENGDPNPSVVNSGGTVTLSTTNRYADIYTGSGSTVTGVDAVAISTADRRSDIEIAGAVTSNASTVDVTTTGDIGTITVDSTGSIWAKTDATVSTAAVDSTIDINGDVTANTGAVLVSTTGDTSDIALHGDADLEGSTDVSVTTTGLGSDITLDEDGAVVNSGGTVTLSTTNRYADIYTGADSSVTGVDAVEITTADRRSDIEIAGDVESTASTVEVKTTGNRSTITLDSTGTILANSDINVETTGTNSDITLNGNIAATNNGIVTVTTADINSDIAQGSSSFIGDFSGNTTEIQYLANGSGNITLGGENAAIIRMSAEVTGSDGLLTVQSTAGLDSLFQVDLKSDHMAFEAGNHLGADLVQFAPENASTTIGVGGGAGTLQLTQDAFDGIDSLETRIGDEFTDSLITLGQLDFRTVDTQVVTFNTLNSVQDATPTDDSGAAKYNLLMADGQNVIFTGGTPAFDDPLNATGIMHVGNEVSVFGDIDISLPGSSLAYVKLPDGLFSGKTIRAITPMGDAFVNITDVNDKLKNLAGALGGQDAFTVTNEATQDDMLLQNQPPADVTDETDEPTVTQE